MKIVKTKSPIEIDWNFKGIRLTTFKCSVPTDDGWEDLTELDFWYDADCENCPLGWEDRSYEGECNDCGCLFNHDFDVPAWKCMLPNFIKNIIKARREKKNARIEAENTKLR